MKEKKEHNPERYARMCEPYNNREEAEAAIEAFFAAVEKLREEHRIKDVTVVFEVNQLLEAGDEGVLSGHIHLGQMAMSEGMLAFAYGRERKRREELMMRLAAGKRS